MLLETHFMAFFSLYYKNNYTFNILLYYIICYLYYTKIYF